MVARAAALASCPSTSALIRTRAWKWGFQMMVSVAIISSCTESTVATSPMSPKPSIAADALWMQSMPSRSQSGRTFGSRSRASGPPRPAATVMRRASSIASDTGGPGVLIRSVTSSAPSQSPSR